MEHYWDLGFQNYQNEKNKFIAELGYSDLLSVYAASFAKVPIFKKKTPYRF